MPSDNLTTEVASLLERTDSLLRSASSTGRALSDDGNLVETSSFRKPAVLAGNRSFARTTSVRSSADHGAPASPRLLGPIGGGSRKFGDSRRASFREPLTIDIPLKDIPEAATPRLADSPVSRAAASTVFTDGASTAILERSASQHLPAAGPGRTYNSFEGLQDMVSLVDDLVAPPGSPGGRASVRAPASSRLSVGSLAAGGGRGTHSELRTSFGGLRSPSRLGSPVASPRSSPLRRAGSPATSGGGTTAAGQGSRRAQLQVLLSRDVAQPQDVSKFKAELCSQPRSPPAITALVGDLQEKFDRVQRKLKNWELVETAATERFNTAMDAALDALFSRIDLSWPGKDLPTASRKAPSSKGPRPSSLETGAAGTRKPGGRHQSTPDNRDHAGQRAHDSPSRHDNSHNSTDTVSSEQSSLSSSTVSAPQLNTTWADVSSSSGSGDEVEVRRVGSGGETSATSDNKRHTSRSASRGRAAGGSSSRQRNKSREAAGAADLDRVPGARDRHGRRETACQAPPTQGSAYSAFPADGHYPALASHQASPHQAAARGQPPTSQSAARHHVHAGASGPVPALFPAYNRHVTAPASPLSSGSDSLAPPAGPGPWPLPGHGARGYPTYHPMSTGTGSGSVAAPLGYAATAGPPVPGSAAFAPTPRAAWAAAAPAGSAPSHSMAPMHQVQQPVAMQGRYAGHAGYNGSLYQPLPAGADAAYASLHAASAIPSAPMPGGPPTHPLWQGGLAAAHGGWPRSAQSTGSGAPDPLAFGRSTPMSSYDAALASSQPSATPYSYASSPQSPTLHRYGGYGPPAGAMGLPNMPMAAGGAAGQMFTSWGT